MNKIIYFNLLANLFFPFSKNPISDITNPTIQEYQTIDLYLREERHFLDELKSYDAERLSHFLEFQLLGKNGEMPVIEKHSFNITENSKNRCLILFASRNGNYERRARELLKEIEHSGYSGHVLLRIGGFPNTERGGLKLCHIPYAFKISMFREAQALGYHEVVWLDLNLHPLTNLEMIFSEVKRNGYFLLKISSFQENLTKHQIKAAESIGASLALYPYINHISSVLLGIDMTHETAPELLELWEIYTQNTRASATYHPDDLCLSVAARNLQYQPFSWFGTIICSADEALWLPQQRPTIQVFSNRTREKEE
jgi:hypothetical protein